jgi:hypothetical protein
MIVIIHIALLILLVSLIRICKVSAHLSAYKAPELPTVIILIFFFLIVLLAVMCILIVVVVPLFTLVIIADIRLQRHQILVVFVEGLGLVSCGGPVYVASLAPWGSHIDSFVPFIYEFEIAVN